MLMSEMTVEQVTRRNERLVEIMKSNPVYINNHNGREEKLTGLVEFNDPYMGLATCCDAKYYSLNACYYSKKDNKLHCSTMSIAGVLFGAYPSSEDIHKYNDEHNIFEWQKRSHIKCIHRPDGTKIYPA